MDVPLNSEESPERLVKTVLNRCLNELMCKLLKLFATSYRARYVDWMKYVGVDGCRFGWFCVVIEGDHAEPQLFANFNDVWKAHTDARLILVDMPIGLPGHGQPVRRADALARRLLGKKRSTIFPPGVRDVLGAGSYAEACEANRLVTGKKISLQFWNLVPKIRDVDAVIQAEPQSLNVIRESHPELCFELAGGEQVTHSKKTAEGVQERLGVLKDFISNCDELYERVLRETLRKDVARDDIVDAMMLAATARASRGVLAPLPDPPDVDERGIPMAIWYHDCEKSK